MSNGPSEGAEMTQEGFPEKSRARPSPLGKLRSKTRFVAAGALTFLAGGDDAAVRRASLPDHAIVAERQQEEVEPPPREQIQKMIDALQKSIDAMPATLAKRRKE